MSSAPTEAKTRRGVTATHFAEDADAGCFCK